LSTVAGSDWKDQVAILVTDGFEEPELTEPVQALKNAGALVTIVSPSSGEVQGVRHDLEKTMKIKVDRTMKEVSADEFDAVQLPGGAVNADRMRMTPEVQAFLRAMQGAGKPIAAICHAPWELVSAGLVRGRTLTSYHTIQDDIRNAGGNLGRSGVRPGWQLGDEPPAQRYPGIQPRNDRSIQPRAPTPRFVHVFGIVPNRSFRDAAQSPSSRAVQRPH
jgi:protease I